MPLLILLVMMFTITANASTLQLSSDYVLVVDQETNQVIYSKNSSAQVPVASITKLMAAMVVLDSKPDMYQTLQVRIHETKELAGVYSRVKVGSKISRKELLHLALMSSENRATATLAFHYPGGTTAFVKAMNRKAQELAMVNTKFVEPTGLSELNVSTPEDLVKLVAAASKYTVISKMSTTPKKTATFKNPRRTLQFVNTNPLVRSGTWSISVSKTGFINEAGRCLVMQATINDQEVIAVFLGSNYKKGPANDAAKIKNWLVRTQVVAAGASNKQLQ